MDINPTHVAEEFFQAQSHLYRHIFSFISSMCLKSAIELGIPDIIHSHGQPITLNELVLALQIDPSKSFHLYRLMRLLVHSNIFATTEVIKEEMEEEDYILTPSSKLLLKDKIPNLAPLAEAVFHPALTNSWHFLGKWFHKNEINLFHTAFGMGFWEYGSQNPDYARLFNEAMVSDSGMMYLVIGDCKAVFEGMKSLVDVGGGTGAAAKIISEAFPSLKCTVLDLPHVVANLEASINLKYVGGDMFESIPSADAILLKWVLHAYTDEDCVKVLKKCREAISSKGNEGKVIIIDIIIDQKKDNHQLTELKLFFDMLMMVAVTGREREEKEWEKLFLEAGFRHYKITPIFGFRSLIEVYP